MGWGYRCMVGAVLGCIGIELDLEAYLVDEGELYMWL